MTEATERAMNEQGPRFTQLQFDVMLKMRDNIKRDQDIRYAPLTLLLSGVGAGAGLIAAGAALFAAAIALLKWLH